ncbi:methyltransferase domain-containing protein [Elizabethkingia anophelis]|uniref:class I SAM-dependent methyltransferase n=1 Tax=Elizabethkingia anophelis TaxID=1117645 RepID=UPI0013681A56|nr:methyltransferase domain-containing protein [Elizabethkingia anophelis]MYZ60343.1 methyltransferase domain-containing protein [Elizabethkingia anophelis]
MIFEDIKSSVNIDDKLFNKIYPEKIEKISFRHWTPVTVAKMAAEYLADGCNKKILDIGSGVGKFCMIGACCTNGIFYGVEQRENLVELSRKIATEHQVMNAHFIHANIMDISFLDYDAFYFFNPFYENIDTAFSIDKVMPLNRELYYTYSKYVKEQLDKTPIGTKVVTYWGNQSEIPPSFGLESHEFQGLLKFWVKLC